MELNHETPAVDVIVTREHTGWAVGGGMHICPACLAKG